eukprot:690994_1
MESTRRRLRLKMGTITPMSYIPTFHRSRVELHAGCLEKVPLRFLRKNFESWTKLEKSTFRMFSVAFRRNYCAISEMMDTKSCKEVHAYARVNGQHIKTGKESECVQSGSRKRKPNRSIYARAKKNFSSVWRACDHAGACRKGNRECACAERGHYCEKYCACPPNCGNRFRGCQCSSERACRTNSCLCFKAHRECDPDLCTNCESALHPAGERRRGRRRACCNSGIRFKQKRPILLGRSNIHGWGAFINEPVVRGDLISEYVGELISQKEADRRGKICDEKNRSYLFDLNHEQIVDAAHKGNKTKFMNHSEKANCYSRVMMVSGDHRIGIYAHRSIAAGDELTFDYRHDHSATLPQWLQKKKRKEGDGGSSSGGSENDEAGPGDSDSELSQLKSSCSSHRKSSEVVKSENPKIVVVSDSASGEEQDSPARKKRKFDFK